MFNKPRIVPAGLQLAILGGLLLLSGCSPGKQMVPVSGRVLYNGKPLDFGTVMLQPERGQPAVGAIQPSGAFSLTTYKEGDGAVVGKHRVRITCYEPQRSPSLPKNSEIISLGKPLIPAKYANYATSGLEVEISVGRNEPLVFRLSSSGDSR
jgi:hypothetical protein